MSKVRILSPRPEINKNTAVDAVFLFIWWGCGFKRQIKIYQGSNVSLDLSQDVINLRGIPNDFAVRCLRNLLIVAPTRF